LRRFRRRILDGGEGRLVERRLRGLIRVLVVVRIARARLEPVVPVDVE
jgi:hypothetical protein